MGYRPFPVLGCQQSWQIGKCGLMVPAIHCYFPRLCLSLLPCTHGNFASSSRRQYRSRPLASIADDWDGSSDVLAGTNVFAQLNVHSTACRVGILLDT